MTPSRTRRTHAMTALALLTGALAGTAPAAPAAAAQGADCAGGRALRHHQRLPQGGPERGGSPQVE